jgi:hypothetical protein
MKKGENKIRTSRLHHIVTCARSRAQLHFQWSYGDGYLIYINMQTNYKNKQFAKGRRILIVGHRYISRNLETNQDFYTN